MTEYTPRVANVSSKAHCEWCCDDGYVLVGYNRLGTDEMGPCPYCEKGFAIEFPEKPRVGPWGIEGYWRGRSTTGIAKICNHGVRPVGPPPDWNALVRRATEETPAP